MPEGVPAKMNLRAGVEAVDQGVEPAADERVVDGADRDEQLAGQLGREAELPSSMNRFISEMPSSMCWPLGRCVPAQQPLAFGLVVGALLRREDADLVDPAAPGWSRSETSGEVVTIRSRSSGRSARRVSSGRTPPGWSVVCAGRGRAAREWLCRHGGAGGVVGVDAGAPPTAAHSVASGCVGGKASHSAPGAMPSRSRSGVDLVGVEQHRVVERVAGEGQPPALDGVGEDDGRARRGRRRPRRSTSSSSAQVVAAQVGQQRRAARRRARLGHGVGELGLLRARRRSVSRARAAPRRAGGSGPGTPRWSCRRCAGAGLAAGARECGLRAALPYFASSTCQPLSANSRLQPRGADAGDDAVQALAVEVDDPEHVAQTRAAPPRAPPPRRCPRPARRRRSGAMKRSRLTSPKCARGVAVRERGEDRRHRAKAHRAGREIDRVRVLGAAGVGLQAAVLAQRGQVRAAAAGRAGTARRGRRARRAA